MKNTLRIRNAIMERLDPNSPIDLTVIPEATSTNDIVAAMARNSALHGTSVMALTQTKGKGRSGKNFFSPEGTGLYLSTLIKPYPSTTYPFQFTVRAAIEAFSTCSILASHHNASPEHPLIKWVNDIYYQDRKVCGILAEGHQKKWGDSWRTDYIVVGVGINLLPPKNGFPGELDGIAGPLIDGDADSEELLIEAATHMLDGLGRSHSSVLTPREKEDALFCYRRYLYGKDRQAEFQRGNDRFTGIIRGVDDDFSLILETNEGERHFQSGEIAMIRRPT